MRCRRPIRDAAAALVLVSRIHARRPAACCAKRDLLAQRDASRATRDRASRAWTSLGLPRRRPTALTVSLFCYPNPALPALLEAWATATRRSPASFPKASQPPRSTASRRRRAAPRRTRARAARSRSRFAVRRPGRVRPQAVGERPQLRARRGLVRARAVGGDSRSCGTSIRRRSDAHLAKLAAFLDRYANGLDAATREPLARLLVRVERRRTRRATAAAWRRAPRSAAGAARARRRLGARARAHSRTSPRNWSILPGIRL